MYSNDFSQDLLNISIFENLKMTEKEQLLQRIHSDIELLAKESTTVPPITVQGLVANVQSLSTHDKAYLYKMCFGLPLFNSGSISDKLGLISILASVLVMQRKKAEKNPENTQTFTAIDIIISVTGKRYEELIKDTPLTKDQLDAIAFMVEEIAYHSTEINLGGLKTKEEIRSTVLQLINDSLPF